jgi:hypothetical protein
MTATDPEIRTPEPPGEIVPVAVPQINGGPTLVIFAVPISAWEPGTEMTFEQADAVKLGPPLVVSPFDFPPPSPQPRPAEPEFDPALAVDRALNAKERQAFTEAVLVGPHDGAYPADWIDEAMNADAFIELTEAWWERFGTPCIQQVAANSGLPQQAAYGLIGAALYAGIGSRVLNENNFLLADVSDTYVVDLAERAALWARGYAEHAGWEAS